MTAGNEEAWEYAAQELRNGLKTITDDQRQENIRMNAIEELLRQIVTWQAIASERIDKHEREIEAIGRQIPWTE